jgi:hypothetical protein
MEMCVVTRRRRLDLLYGAIFARFCDVGRSGLFLELLEPFILNERLRELDPAVLMALAAHFEARGLLRRLEQVLLHVDMHRMNAQQVIDLCRKHSLTTALVYAYCGAGDFVTPVRELLRAMRTGPEQARVTMAGAIQPSVANVRPVQHRRDVGYRLLLFLSHGLSGVRFPKGEEPLPAEMVPGVKRRLLEVLLSRDGGACTVRAIRKARLLTRAAQARCRIWRRCSGLMCARRLGCCTVRSRTRCWRTVRVGVWGVGAGWVPIRAARTEEPFNRQTVFDALAGMLLAPPGKPGALLFDVRRPPLARFGLTRVLGRSRNRPSSTRSRHTFWRQGPLPPARS